MKHSVFCQDCLTIVKLTALFFLCFKMDHTKQYAYITYTENAISNNSMFVVYYVSNLVSKNKNLATLCFNLEQDIIKDLKNKTERNYCIFEVDNSYDLKKILQSGKPYEQFMLRQSYYGFITTHRNIYPGKDNFRKRVRNMMPKLYGYIDYCNKIFLASETELSKEYKEIFSKESGYIFFKKYRSRLDLINIKRINL